MKKLAGMKVPDGILSPPLSSASPIPGATYLPPEVPNSPISVERFMLAEDSWYPPSREEVEVSRKCLSELGVLDLLRRRLDTLSSGERRLVGIAKSMTKGKTLLLDEPTSNLDPFNAFIVARNMVELSFSRTVVAATHDLSILPLANWVIMIKGGKLMDQRTPQEVEGDLLTTLYGVKFVEVEGAGRRFFVPSIKL